MTPLQAMTKAAWEKQHGTRIWDTRVSDEHKKKFCEYMRAALLALAGAMLTDERVLVTGPNGIRTTADDRRDIFRVICANIANEMPECDKP